MYLQAGVNVNLQDILGDTPLHKAACTGRKVCVHFLFQEMLSALQIGVEQLSVINWSLIDNK